jgi:pilus assembly protein TadC
MDYTKLLEQSPKILFAILIAGALFLLAPASVLGFMSLNDFWLRPYIGIVTIVAASLLLMHGAGYLVDRVKVNRAKKREQQEWQRRVADTLSSLTSAEKLALRSYILEGQNSALFNIGDGVAGGLEAK